MQAYQNQRTHFSMYKKTTQIPNLILDQYLKILSASELKILLVILRQTHGWIDCYTGKRKTRDRVSYSQFMEKTGYSRRILTSAIKSLESKVLITITGKRGNSLETARSRRGSWLYLVTNMCTFRHKEVQFQILNIHRIAQDKTKISIVSIENILNLWQIKPYISPSFKKNRFYGNYLSPKG